MTAATSSGTNVVDIDELVRDINSHELSSGPITRTMIAIYAGASGDYNGIHVDSDFARAAGLPDVIAHGMYSMGLLSRLCTRLAPRAELIEIAVRFQAMVELGAALTCRSQVTGRSSSPDGTLLELALSARKADGSEATAGTARLRIRGAVP